MTRSHILFVFLPAITLLSVPVTGTQPELSMAADPCLAPAVPNALAPVAVAPLGDTDLAVLGAEGKRLIIVDRHQGEPIRVIRLPAEGSGMAVRGRLLYVTTDEPAGRLLEIDTDSGRIERQWRVGHYPCSPVLTSDGKTVFVANRFQDLVRSVDLETGTQRTAKVIREPIAMALGPRGERLFVANHLPLVRPFLDDENPTMYSEVSVVDTRRMEQIAAVELPNGSQGLRGIALAPGGECVAVTHIMSNFVIPTMEVAGGAMNRNALSLIRTDSLDLLATVMLDDPRRGAANPWGVCFTEDGRSLVVSHAGTHEISVIDWPALKERAAERNAAAEYFDDDSLTTMRGIRRRITLPVAGPRAVCTVAGKGGDMAYAAGYFSDNLAAIDLGKQPQAVTAWELGPRIPTSLARKGEQYFNDATLCSEHWQSCATCHPDGRADALYWDLLNDGVGNTKNTKSLLMAALTPPAMSRGVRADAGMAVSSGIRHIQFAEPSEEQAGAIEHYLLKMKVVPSPTLNADVLETPKIDSPSCAKCHVPGVPRGSLTESARRGKQLFEGKAGCSACHPHPYFTSMKTVDAGLGTGIAYDIPSLVGVWRTTPYLHHGDSLSLKETITDYNHLQMRGQTKGLSEKELGDLLEYVRSL